MKQQFKYLCITATDNDLPTLTFTAVICIMISVMYPKEVKDQLKYLVFVQELFYFLNLEVSRIWHTIYLGLLTFSLHNLASNSKLECLPFSHVPTVCECIL